MYKIKLPVFEGPFDLLLYLIKKNEIDIYDIPIAQITREYLEYLNLMQMLDLEVAGEFIEMVATLILIKTRMLLPSPPSDSLEDVEDPRLQLTLQLLEYRRFKEAADQFKELEEERRHYFPRQVDVRTRQMAQKEPDEEFEVDASLFDLLTAFKRALDNMPKKTVHHVTSFKVTLEDQVGFIIKRFQGKPFIYFGELVKEFTEKIYLIVTFMAILDLMKVGLISAKQSQPFDDIRLVAKEPLSMSRYLQLREEVEVEIPSTSSEG
ncbi:MAG: segregation/condensation protein A [Calditrichaeota bacterium]|nr:MAG: segregation/condensation protein A [Calditrichota bacterium]